MTSRFLVQETLAKNPSRGSQSDQDRKQEFTIVLNKGPQSVGLFFLFFFSLFLLS